MPDDNRRAEMAAKLALVRQRFVDRLPERRAELLTLVAQAAAGEMEAAGAARADLRRGLHSLAGSGPTLGFREFGAQARALEAQVVAASSIDGRFDAMTRAALSEGVAALSVDEMF